MKANAARFLALAVVCATMFPVFASRLTAQPAAANLGDIHALVRSFRGSLEGRQRIPNVTREARERFGGELANVLTSQNPTLQVSGSGAWAKNAGWSKTGSAGIEIHYLAGTTGAREAALRLKGALARAQARFAPPSPIGGWPITILAVQHDRFRDERNQRTLGRAPDGRVHLNVWVTGDVRLRPGGQKPATITPGNLAVICRSARNPGEGKRKVPPAVSDRRAAVAREFIRILSAQHPGIEIETGGRWEAFNKNAGRWVRLSSTGMEIHYRSDVPNGRRAAEALRRALVGARSRFPATSPARNWPISIKGVPQKSFRNGGNQRTAGVRRDGRIVLSLWVTGRV